MVKGSPWKSVIKNRNYKPGKRGRSLRQRAVTRSELPNGGEEWKDENGRLHREDGPARIVRHSNGNVKDEMWYKNGKIHRDGDLPAVFQYYPDGELEFEFWMKEDKKHRVDNPAVIKYYKSGKIDLIIYYVEGLIHREGAPASESYYENGVQGIYTWFIRGKKHRLDGPAFEKFHKNGNPMEKVWYRDDKIHCEDGPAKEIFYENGQIKTREWYRNDYRHRDDGPARESFFMNGNPDSISWYKNNIDHREDGPARTYFYSNGGKQKEEWFFNGKNRHPVDLQKPSTIEYNVNGSIRVKRWTDENGYNYRAGESFIVVYEDDMEGVEQIVSEAGGSDVVVYGEEWNDIILKAKQGSAKGDVILSLFNAGIDFEERYEDEKAQRIEYFESGKPSKVIWTNWTDSYELLLRDDESNTKRFSTYVIFREYVFESEYTQSETVSQERTYALDNREKYLESFNDQPSRMIYDEMENIIEEQWHNYDVLSREGDLPALIKYRPSGEILYQEWVFQGLRGRPNNEEPSIIEYHETVVDGSSVVKRREWFIEGRHRTRAQGGPGFIEYSLTGEVVREIYYNELDEDDFETREDYPIKEPNPVCDTVFQPRLESTGEFIERINTLKTECYKIESTTDCDRYSRNIFRLLYSTITVNEMIPTIVIPRGRELEAAFKNSIPLNRTMSNYYVRFLKADGTPEEGIDAGGLRRQFFNSVCKQALDLFEYLNINSDDRRMFVSGKTDEELLQVLNRNGQAFTLDEIPMLYTFIGNLFIHAIINEYSTEIPLSRVLLKAMVEADNGLATNDLLLYYLLETDVGNVIGQVYEYDLGEAWLYETANSAYGIKNSLVRSRVDAFINGFSIATPFLANAKILPLELYRRVCITNITPEIFTKFIREDVRFGASSEQKRFIIESLTGSVFDTFVAELEFPVPVSSLNDRKTTFYKLLLKFWGEVNMIKPRVEYRFDEDRTMKRDAAFFPHTCFHQLTFNPIMINATDPINTEYEDPKMFFLNRLWASMAGSGVFTSR